MRVGPGSYYPVKWVYGVRGLPMKYIESYDDWMCVQDIDGERGWIMRNMLTYKNKNALVLGVGSVHKRKKDTSRVVINVKRMSMVHVDKCRGGWCRVSAGGKKGWIRKGMLWGA